MQTVLIVEDNPDIAVMYERLFMGYQTHIVTNAKDATVFLDHNRPNLIILDFHLSGSRGLDVLEYINVQPTLGAIPVLGVSADDLMQKEAKAKGLTAFLPKPIDIDRFFDVTRQLLQQ